LGVAERREREKKRRREEILSAAERVIFKNGVDKATMDEVAEEAELSKATLYLYFSSKEELYFAIFLKGQEILFNMITKATEQIADTREKIAMYLSTVITFQKKYPDYFEAFFYFLTKTVEISEESFYKKQHKESGKSFLNSWVELVQKGKTEAVIRKNLNEVPVAIILWMQLIGFLKIYPVLKRPLKKEFNVTEESLLTDYFELIFSGMIRK
jgi:AcrR family transcriptional regulator